VEDGAEPNPDRPALGASSDEPKRLAGGGFEGVVEVDGAWNWKVGGAFFSVAATSPNLIGVPGLKVWSPANVSDFAGAEFGPAAAPKSKKANG